MIILPTVPPSKCSPHRSCPKMLPYDSNRANWSPSPGSLGNICTFGPSSGLFHQSLRLFGPLWSVIFLIHMPEGTSESPLGYSSPGPSVILKCEWNHGSEVAILSHLICLPEPTLALLNLSTHQSVSHVATFFLFVYANLLKQLVAPSLLTI